jgi:multiple sugar transport system ATP-binding protein
VRVKVKDLTKRFGNVFAVNNVSFETNDGEFLVLLGPSGCGKTTTLRCIAGLETPDSGEIYIGDMLLNELPPRDRNVAMVFQSYALYPHMTCFHNIAFPLKMHKFPKSEIKNKVKRVAELLRITDVLDRKPNQISGGQAQRVALARCIVRDPNVFLMDEPLSNLDAKLRIYMRTELKRLQRDLGITTIYVTHDQMEAMTMADRVAIMNQGALQQFSDVNEIYNKPANLFVAGFVGSPPMNFIDCKLIEKSGLYFLESDTFMLQIPYEMGKAVKEEATGSELILGIRPEDIFIERSAPHKFIDAEVYLIEPLGSEIVVDLKVGNNLIKAKTHSLTVRFSQGQRVCIEFDKEKIHIFDKKTENFIC